MEHITSRANPLCAHLRRLAASRAYREEAGDLFAVPEDYCLAHCISADFAMGKGIVLEFNRRFDMKRLLRQRYPTYLADYRQNATGGDCLREGGC